MTNMYEFEAISLTPNLFSDSVGTLGEKSLHRSIKYYIEPNSAYHEIKLGRFIADIFKENHITEVQTGSFSPLAKKLPSLLEEHSITVVYPIPHSKRIFLVDKTSGEITGGRKSPRKGSFYNCFYELRRIPKLLSHPNFNLRLILVDMDEYRLPEGYSRRVGKRTRLCTKLEQIPSAIVGDITIASPEDFANFLPPLPELFTLKELATATKSTANAAAMGLFALEAACAVRRVGKRGNAILYKKITDVEENCL